MKFACKASRVTIDQRGRGHVVLSCKYESSNFPEFEDNLTVIGVSVSVGLGVAGSVGSDVSGASVGPGVSVPSVGTGVAGSVGSDVAGAPVGPGVAATGAGVGEGEGAVGDGEPEQPQVPEISVVGGASKPSPEGQSVVRKNGLKMRD